MPSSTLGAYFSPRGIFLPEGQISPLGANHVVKNWPQSIQIAERLEVFLFKCRILPGQHLDHVSWQYTLFYFFTCLQHTKRKKEKKTFLFSVVYGAGIPT
jgi:hypothetical protein